jgi:molybdate transport system substrate-binding protein
MRPTTLVASLPCSLGVRVRFSSNAAVTLFLLSTMAFPGLGSGEEPRSVEVNLYAAASLRDVLQDLAPPCETALGVRLVFNVGASNDLARQIIAAPGADVFFSADEGWVEKVAQAGLVDDASRRALLSNRLVVVGRADAVLPIARAEDLRSASVRRIALANPEVVPAGKYAKAWLERVGVWESIRDRIAPSLDVRAALAAVESGAVDVGVVYKTDAEISRKVRVLYEVPGDQGPGIVYVIAAISGRPHLDIARRVVTWLEGPEAARAFEKRGFIVMVAPPA